MEVERIYLLQQLNHMLEEIKEKEAKIQHEREVIERLIKLLEGK